MMHILIATPLAIYMHDPASGKLDMLEFGKGEYYGLSWNDQSIFIGASNIDSATLRTAGQYRNSGIGTVRELSPGKTRLLCSGLSQPHQINMDAEGKLLVTSTGFNTIGLVDTERRTLFQRRFGDHDVEVANGVKVGNHLNSVSEHEGQYWAVAHNNERKSELWRLRKTDLSLEARLQLPAYWAHNLFFCEDGILICDSKNGALIDQQSSEIVWTADEKRVITRGLAATATHLYIGRSEYGNRYSRRFSNGGYWVVNRKTMRTEQRVVLQGTGCTNELRLVGIRDLCHGNSPVLHADRLRASLNPPKLQRSRKALAVATLRSKNLLVHGVAQRALSPFIPTIRALLNKSDPDG